MYREVPLAIGAICGIVVVLQYFVKMPALDQASSLVQNWVVVIAAFMMGLGAISLITRHVREISRGKNVVPSIFLVASLILMFTTGALLGQENVVFKRIYQYGYEPLITAAFASLMFHAATVMFRAFRARNIDSTLFLVSAAIVIFGRSTLGEAVAPSVKVLADWLFDVPNMAGQRGIVVGSAIGAVSVGLRVISGLERAYLGE